MFVRNHLLYIAILLAAFFAGCDEGVIEQEQTGPVALQFNLAPDSIYQYSVKNNITLTQEIDAENSITIHQNMTLSTAYKVLAKKGRNTTVSVTYERITMSSGNQLYALEFDSETDNGTDIMYEDLRNLIDKTFRMTVSSSGEVVSSEPVNKGAGGNNNAAYFSDSSIRKMMMETLYVYPSGQVQPGDIWDKDFLSSVGFANVRIRNRYMLSSVKNRVAHIEMQGRISSTNTAQARDSDMSLKGTQTGSFDIELETGLVKSGNISQKISGEMDITGTKTPVTIESGIYILGGVKK